MTTPAIDFEDLPPEVQKQLKANGIKKPRKTREVSLTIHQVRTYAIKALATLAELNQKDRFRVLRQMHNLNQH